MKKILFLLALFTIIFLFSCSAINEILNEELFKLTDKCVDSLYTEYESYGLLGGDEELTSNGKYQIKPIGRLVNVKIMIVEDLTYRDLENDLKEHYKNNQKVNDIYICNAGTIIIDCRRNNWIIYLNEKGKRNDKL